MPWIERRRPSLSVIMNMQRRRWVANAAKRETPFDAILSGNIMQSVSFLASTAVLMVLAVFAVFGQLPTLMAALDSLSLDRAYSVSDVEIHLVVMLALFVLAFFAFTLSLRQFNHFCIMLGALDHNVETPEDEIEAIARMNALGAKNFNSGIRAYYFSVATVAWFASEWLAIAFALTRPFMTSVIIGATSTAQLGNAIGAAKLTLSPEVLTAIEAIHRRWPRTI